MKVCPVTMQTCDSTGCGSICAENCLKEMEAYDQQFHSPVVDNKGEVERLRELIELVEKRYLRLYHKLQAGYKLPEILEMEIEAGWQKFKTENNIESVTITGQYQSKENPGLVPSMKEVIDAFVPHIVEGEKYYHFDDVTFMMAEYSLINDHLKSIVKRYSKDEVFKIINEYIAHLQKEHGFPVCGSDYVACGIMSAAITWHEKHNL